jgi:hypothetical protein
MKIRHALTAAAVAALAGCAAHPHPVIRPAAAPSPLSARPPVNRPPQVWDSASNRPLLACDPDGASNPPPCTDTGGAETVLTTAELELSGIWSVSITRDAAGHWHAARIDFEHDTTTALPHCLTDDGTATGGCVWDATMQGNGEGTSFLAIAGDPHTYLLVP